MTISSQKLPRMITQAMIIAFVVLMLCCGSRGVRVVTLGDSFTEGWIPTPEEKAPPAVYAQQCLDYRLGGSNLVENQGIGWGSVVDKEHNITQHVVDVVIPGAGKKGYDWAVVWTGGVNDFFNSKYKGGVQGVFDATKELWDLLLKQGWRVVVIPQVSLITFAKTSKSETLRQEFVAMEKNYIAKADDPNLKYVDLEALGLDGWSMSKEETSMYFDGVHLTKAGYDRVGQVLCDFITAWVRKQPLDTIKYTPLTSSYRQLPKSYPLNSAASAVDVPPSANSTDNASDVGDDTATGTGTKSTSSTNSTSDVGDNTATGRGTATNSTNSTSDVGDDTATGTGTKSTNSTNSTSDVGDNTATGRGTATSSTIDTAAAAATDGKDADVTSKSSETTKVISSQPDAVNSRSSNSQSSNNTGAPNAANTSTTTAAKSGSMGSVTGSCVLLAACMVVAAVL